VLFIHGFPLDRELWAAQLSGLRGHRLIAPDLRGFGLSETKVAAKSLATYGDDLIALLDKLGVAKAVMCGLSMGGYIAFDLVRRHRERVAGLILLDTRAPGAGEAGKTGQNKLIAMAESGGAAAVSQDFAGRLFAEGTAQVVREAVTSRMRRTQLSGVVAGLAAIRDREDSVELLGALAGIPTLVIVGKEDRITPPADAHQIAAGIPGATLVEIAGAGHLPPVEQPEAVTKAIQGFLDRLG
jgi:pimeloyl-ACP methyl ester carboxylesterase